MKVIIVGLPLFGKRLADNLTAFDPKNSYTFLDTYYSKKDKLKALFKVPKADVVFSINGAVKGSKVFNMAFDKNVPVIMNWVGTDVTKAISIADPDRRYIEQAHHYCEVNWIQDELKQLEISAEIVNFAVFEAEFNQQIPEGPFTVLTYIPANRSDFYGLPALIELAVSSPKTKFIIAGATSDELGELPSNVEALGWIKEMDPVFRRAHVCMRYPEHDGLSNFILEALARGKEVLYKYNFDHCNYSPDVDSLKKNLAELQEKHASGSWTSNDKGAEYIREHFNRKVILGGLIDRFKKLSGK